MTIESFSFHANRPPTHQIADPIQLTSILTYGKLARGTSGRQKTWKPTVILTQPDGNKQVIGEVRKARRYSIDGFSVDVRHDPNHWITTDCFVATEELGLKVLRLLIEEMYP